MKTSKKKKYLFRNVFRIYLIYIIKKYQIFLIDIIGTLKVNIAKGIFLKGNNMEEICKRKPIKKCVHWRTCKFL